MLTIFRDGDLVLVDGGGVSLCNLDETFVIPTH